MEFYVIGVLVSIGVSFSGLSVMLTSHIIVDNETTQDRLLAGGFFVFLAGMIAFTKM